MKHRCWLVTFAERVPGVSALAKLFERIASARWGRLPIGLFALLPVALFIDTFDALDELAGGPLGMALSFLVQSAFLLALTGRATLAFGLAGIDLVPVVDVLPWATIMLIRQIVAEMRRPEPSPRPPVDGPVIDV